MEPMMSRPKVFIDTNLFVSGIFEKDSNHQKAKEILDLTTRANAIICVSPLVLLEICVTLRGKGLLEDEINSICDKLINNESILVVNIDSSQIVHVVNNLLNKKINLRSNDLMISAIPIVFQMYFITFDEKIYNGILPIYGAIAKDVRGLDKLLSNN